MTTPTFHGLERATREHSDKAELPEYLSERCPMTNYSSVEENAVLGAAELDRNVTRGQATSYKEWSDVLTALGPVLVAKLGCLVKTRPDGSLKVRMLTDLKRSHYNEFVELCERVVLPTLNCSVVAVLELQDQIVLVVQNGDQVFEIVIDFEDAFLGIGVHHSERKYVVVMHPRSGYVGYETLMFGGAGNPLVWGRYGAYLGRSGQSMFEEHELRVNIFVDDPKIAVRGANKEEAAGPLGLVAHRRCAPGLGQGDVRPGQPMDRCSDHGPVEQRGGQGGTDGEVHHRHPGRQ